MCGSTTAGAQGICPNGWHVPTDAELTTLTNNVCGDTGDEGSALAGNASLWNDGVLESDNDFDCSGYDLLPAGYRTSSGSYYSISYYAFWWSSTEYDSSYAWYRIVGDNNTDVARYHYYGKTYGFSLRCLKDSSETAYEKYGATAFTNQDDTGNSEATNTDYDNISSTNDVRWETAGATADGEYDSQLYKFYIDEFESGVTQLDFKWQGYGETESGYSTDFYVWDYNASAWELLASQDFTSATDIDLTDAISSNTGNYIDGDGEVVLMVKSTYAEPCPEFTDCICSGTGYETVNCSNGDTIYVDCNADKCWTPTSGSTYAWGGYGIDEPTNSCVGIANRPACNYCDNLDYGGKTDWVLPSSGVLAALCNSGSCSSTCFGGDGSSSTYWSSTEYISSHAYRVYFNGCGVSYGNKNAPFYVRCVR